jgi:hypothetical protein
MWFYLLASGQRGRLQLVHGDADGEALAVEEVWELDRLDELIAVGEPSVGHLPATSLSWTP